LLRCYLIISCCYENSGLYPAFQGLLIFIAKFPASDVRCSQLNELLGFDIALKQIKALFQVLGQSSFRSGYAWSDDSRFSSPHVGTWQRRISMDLKKRKGARATQSGRVAAWEKDV